MRLLVLDLDGTLIDTTSANGLLPPPELFAVPEAYLPWRNYVEMNDFPPVAGAISGAKAFLSVYGAAPLILTGRNASLEAASREWLQQHAPFLGDPDLLMRQPGDKDPPWLSKSKRLREYRIRKFPNAPVIVVDDDAEMVSACETPEDRFILVNQSWENLIELPCCRTEAYG